MRVLFAIAFWVGLKGCSRQEKGQEPHPEEQEELLVVENNNDVGRRGLVNLGNTCYLNSLLQAFMHTNSVRSSISVLPQESIQTSHFLGNMTALFHAQWEGEDQGPIKPRSLFKNLHAHNPLLFRRNIQQDAHEAFIALANLMREAHESLDLFRFSINTALRCENGPHSSNLDQTQGMVLLVPRLDIPVALEDLISEYLRPESIAGVAACWGRTAQRAIEVVQLPRVVVFSLNRNDYTNPKILTAVRFPDEISASLLLASNPDDGRRYRLTAVVNHLGVSVDSGHYTANVLLNGEWWNADDSVVRKLKELAHVSRKAALLFYELVSPEIPA